MYLDFNCELGFGELDMEGVAHEGTSVDLKLEADFRRGVGFTWERSKFILVAQGEL